MVLGLGVDIVEIERMRTALSRRSRMKDRLFSEDERWYCEHKAHPEIHYALRFAAKEAVLKALGTGFAGMAFRDVEVAHDERGRPFPRLAGAAQARADELGVIEMHLSLSYTHETAVASAVAITADARPKKEKLASPQEELAREFRELRSLLDELESGLVDEDEKQPSSASENVGTPFDRRSIGVRNADSNPVQAPENSSYEVKQNDDNADDGDGV